MVCKIVGLSIPEELLKEIDNKRGDITRSTFISKKMKKVLEAEDSKVKI